MIFHDNHYALRANVEAAERWDTWTRQIPAIRFDPGWSVTVIPPYHGALVRFLVAANGRKVSVYLDVHEALGYMGGPYWEVYPVDDDTARCGIDDVDELLLLIRRGLEVKP